MKLTRRGLLLTGTAALLSRRDIAAESSPGLTTLSPSPKDLEMPVEDFIDEITPVKHFFVRCHTMIPQVNLAEWKLEIAGLVEHPLSFTLSDLKKLPRAELVSVLECAGNGRAFYRPSVAGAQWRFGSVGNARWDRCPTPETFSNDPVLNPGRRNYCSTEPTCPSSKCRSSSGPRLEVAKAMHPRYAPRLGNERYATDSWKPTVSLSVRSRPAGPAIPGSSGSRALNSSITTSTASG